MTGNSLQSLDESKDARARRTTGAAAPETDGLVDSLERLRSALLKRLDAIETLAAQEAEFFSRDSTEREQALRERVSVLEAAHARLLAESRRREQEWQEALRQLEIDRELLAEAWDRLEQLQMQFEPRAVNHAPAVPPMQPSNVLPPAVSRPPVDDPDDPVTRAVLRQFQALSNDVRRNAKGRGSR